MLLAEELALVAIDPDSGRHGFGDREHLNACLAGLLVAELIIDGMAGPGKGKGTIVLTDSPRPASPLLAAAAEVLDDKGPKIKSVLSGMSRGLDKRLGRDTWDAVTDQLVAAGCLAPPEGGRWERHHVVDPAARDAIIDRLRAAAAGDEPVEVRTAVVLSMSGPANLLEVVAPDRHTRKHARRRIDHALDSGQLQPIGDTVRQLLAEAAAALTVVAVAGAGGAATTGG